MGFLQSNFILSYLVVIFSSVLCGFSSANLESAVYTREVTVDECTSGVPGSQGFPGPPGQKGEQGGVVTIEPNWRHCAWWQTNDGRDSGQVYSCSFTKEHSDTYLYVSMSSNLRLAGSNAACCRWYFTFNNNECSNPAKIEAVVYANGYSSYNLHRPRVFMGYCKGLGAGSYSIGLYVGTCSGYGTYDCYTGWISSSHMIIEEVKPSPYD